MRRQPIRRRPLSEQRFARVGRVRTLPPPVGGWNRKDSLENMPLTDAVSMINWFPRQSDCITRPGYAEHCDISGSPYNAAEIEQLIPHEAGANNVLIAATADRLTDVTTSTPSALATSLNNGHWSYDFLSGVTLLANGADVVKSFNGSAIANPAFTGVTLSTLNHVHVFKTRAYFVEASTQSMWYGATGAIAGALTEFDFGGVTGIRGNLSFTTHLKGDGGDGGQDDVFIAVFEGGDVLAYSGSDPGDPTDWALVGRFRIGRPLSRLSYLAAEDDVYVITDRGYEQLSRMVSFGDLYKEQTLFSNKIQLEVSERIQELGTNLDWRIARYPKEQMMFFQVPRTGDARSAHVRNINTGAWTNFVGLKNYCFGLFQGNLYFGGNDGKIYQFGAGATSDAGVAIRADAQQAWTNLGSPGITKHMHLVKPFLFSQSQPSLSVNMGANYSAINLASFTSAGTSNQAVWADNSIPSGAVWDTAIWSGADATWADWYSRNAIGEAIGMRLAVDSDSFQTRWNQTTLEYTLGGYL